MNPLQVPQRGLYGKRYPFTEPVCISLEYLIKIPLNKEFSPSEKERPSIFPPNEVTMETDAHYQSFNPYPANVENMVSS